MENININNEVYSNQLLSNKFSCHLPLGVTKLSLTKYLQMLHSCFLLQV